MPPRAYEAGGWRTVTVVIAGNAQRGAPVVSLVVERSVAVIDAFTRPVSTARSTERGLRASESVFCRLLVCYRSLARGPGQRCSSACSADVRIAGARN